LTVRQSSAALVTVWKNGVSKSLPRTSEGKELVALVKNICGQAVARRTLVTVPIGSVNGCGGLSRRVPVGGSAKGMPLKVSTVVPTEPIIVLTGYAMVTVGVTRFSMTGAARATEKTPKRGKMDFMVADL
jgi:hypothetical protein